jgi:hypothetical protein
MQNSAILQTTKSILHLSSLTIRSTRIPKENICFLHAFSNKVHQFAEVDLMLKILFKKVMCVTYKGLL